MCQLSKAAGATVICWNGSPEQSPAQSRPWLWTNLTLDKLKSQITINHRLCVIFGVKSITCIFDKLSFCQAPTNTRGYLITKFSNKANQVQTKFHYPTGYYSTPFEFIALPCPAHYKLHPYLLLKKSQFPHLTRPHNVIWCLDRLPINEHIACEECTKHKMEEQNVVATINLYFGSSECILW